MAKFEELDALKARLDSHRPLDEGRIRAVREKFRLEWTYHSNALEGNPLTLSETSFFIREGMTSKGKPLSSYVEAKNHVAALDFLEEIVRKKEAISVWLTKQFHAMLFEKIDFVEVGSGADRQRVKVEGGTYKTEANHVVRLDGKILEFTDPLHVPEAMEKLVAWYSDRMIDTHPVEVAANFHHKLVSIHPFTDGNGRVSRLLLNTILMQAGYTPAIIPVEEKKRYLEALQTADEGNLQPLITLVEEFINRSLVLTLDVIEGRDAFDLDDLSRMFRNIVEESKAIGTELGRAVTPPVTRAHDTSKQIAEVLLSILGGHAGKVSVPEVQTFPQRESSVEMAAAIIEVRNSTPDIQWEQTIRLRVQSDKRHIPQLDVNFVPLWNRFNVTLVSWVKLGKFSQQNSEVMTYEPGSHVLRGSIHYEEWDRKWLEEFVLGSLKSAYMIWAEEMDRRKTLIAEEEAEVSKHLPPLT